MLKIREGKLVGESPQPSSRRAHFPQSPQPVSPQVSPKASPVMAHEGETNNMTEVEKDFIKTFFDMNEMVKDIYEERNSRLQGESSNPPKGNGGNGDKPPKWNGGNGDKPPLPPPLSSPSSSPPSSLSSSSTSTPSQTPPQYLKGHGKTPFLNLDIKFHFPMYDGEVDAKKL